MTIRQSEMITSFQIKAKWHEDLGWKKGMLLKIDKNSDGSTTMKKA
jgi:hypothetical protein